MKPAINITNLFTAINSATMIEMAPEITDANKTIANCLNGISSNTDFIAYFDIIFINK